MEWNMVKERLNVLLEADKKSELRGALRMLNVVDVAGYLSELESDKMLRVFRLLPNDISSDVFSYMDDDQQEKLISSIGDSEIRALVDDMFLDDAVDFLEDLPDELVKKVLSNVSEDTRKLINKFLSYPENSAGSIMTIEFCSLHRSYTVGEAMAYIRKNGVDKETINTLYVVDDNGKLCGTLPLRKLIAVPDETEVSAIMDVNFVSVTTTTDQEEVAEEVRKYDLLAIPVVNKEGRPVGIITIDDIMDVMQEEATEDMEMMSALTPSDDSYMKTNVVTLTKNRLPWLMIMTVISILTEFIISRFEGMLAGFGAAGVALMACIPMLMDASGNSGQQSATLVIRGLATGELTPKDSLRVLWKELRVSLIIAFIMAIVCFSIQCLLFGREFIVALSISLSMLCAVIVAKAVGGLLPMAAKSLKLDPALTASPLITTIADTGSLLLLFGVARMIL